MPNLGMGELIIVLLIVLLIFGASRLPQIGEGLGKAIKGLKRGLTTDDDIDVSPKGGDKQMASKSSADAIEDENDVRDAEIVEKNG